LTCTTATNITTLRTIIRISRRLNSDRTLKKTCQASAKLVAALDGFM